MANIGISVAISSSIDYFDHDCLIDLIRKSISPHIESRRDEISDINLSASVSEFRGTSENASIAISFHGQINGMPFECVTKASRSPDRLRNAGSGVGTGIGEIVNALVVNVTSNAFHSDALSENLSQCFMECMAEFFLAIDVAISHRESAASARWRKIELSRWIAMAVMLVAIALIGMLARGAVGLLLLILPGLFVAPATFWLVHVVGLVIMPSRFFLCDPRGQKAFARSGAASIVAVRAICVVLALIFAAVLFGSAMFILEGVRRAATE